MRGVCPDLTLEEVVSFSSVKLPLAAVDLYIRLPNLEALILHGENLSTVFPTSDQSKSRIYEVIPSSLRHIYSSSHSNHSWGSLMAFLSHRASVGNPIVSLTFLGSPHLSREA